MEITSKSYLSPLSTPHGDGSFNVYDDIRDKLVASGIPKEEIQFIHDADTEIKKKELFAKVRSGQVRILFGSTQKLGAGTNVQDRLIALHDLDAPWRPGDLEPVSYTHLDVYKRQEQGRKPTGRSARLKGLQLTAVSL